jgi:protease IV
MTYAPPPEVRPPIGPPMAPPQPRRFSILGIILAILLGLSLLANAALLMGVLGLAAMLGSTGEDEGFVEHTLQKGPAADKIAVIHVDGLIGGEMAAKVRRQLDMASRDTTVKAVILRVNSRGGELTASDMIYHDIGAFRAQSGKPVVTSMDGMAASGGYYISCGTDRIIAQQTTITGSIGIIAQFFFLGGLLENKLGVTTATLKMGEQKDWPNMFGTSLPEEQQKYLMNTLLRPGYDRFVKVVSDARHLKTDEVEKLATGRIFMAAEAKEKGLIDAIGYFDDAVQEAKQRAGLSEAQVVEYAPSFRLLNLLGLQAQRPSILDLKPENLAELASPRIMYLWTGF